MNTINIRNVEIGTGIPKICVPIIGKTREDILTSAKEICSVGTDLVEWRADWYQDVFIFSEVERTANELRHVLEEIPLLFTFRSKKEGGNLDINPDLYTELNHTMIKSGCIDLIDTELFMGEDVVRSILSLAHSCGVKVIVSNHDFIKTPPKDELIRRMQQMQDLGADIPKIAVMPQNKQDVLTLLSATEEMTRKYADRPIITMSMAGTGTISRLCGEIFGSSVTFGSSGNASAPGQLPVNDLKIILSLLHKSL